MMQSRERNRHGYTSGSFLNPEASTRAFNDPPCPTPLSTTHQGSSVVASPGSLSRPPCWTAIACFRAVSVVTFFCFFRCHLCSYPWHTTSVLMSKDYRQVHSLSILALGICS
ncbi:hypothetical protein FOQG_08518 [Fusarium oxysporum f. sp. raphani 54005]|uniref:Uncharacterized protein n=4 Tax=Fusarium oxysporum TaxID=5507 RepID=X0C1T9_FUSOX|nr:hypothetical protein FOVG_01045 [Fusarium oxysporum f. sp. pisi HDV247]EXK88116.1 hypothetical protein FOQG_08518 [Fusarium oxysporum f. sp. raphani 54005]EXL80901.1 hypothetical protein FOPG_05842 [Fusarium oxysporum f. sp. conglutinans race 2 54008]EXM24151.1 hypothetical protein FOTG_08652 [Fusarium oxysporum f. sp. vasinfectum 25433]KAI8418670.1 hypothetical protein FOFC_01240 [Fusarium oxysporum]